VDDERDIGVALSGGGHRATTFSLGALLALTDAGLNRRTVSISSVSGGSIANGIVMVGPDYGTADPAEVEQHMGRALAGVATRGLLLGGAPATRWYLRRLVASLILAILAVVVLVVSLIGHWWTPGAIAAAGAVVFNALTWIQFRRRSIRTEAATDKELLGDASVTLGDLHRRASSVHHVICATEIQTGVSFYFTNRAVYGYGFGGSRDEVDVPLSLAVQSSACVPGAFAPRTVELSRLHLGGEGRIVVVDGGVYDNMADEWEYGYASRSRTWDGLASTQPNPARMLVVVNGSGGWNRTKPVGRSGLATEIAGLSRAQAVQYDVSTAHRRRALYDRFRDADREGHGLDGVFAQITDNPYTIPQRFGSKPGREPDVLASRADEARAFLDAQGYTPDWWKKIVGETSGVPTTLAPLGVDTTAKLLEHGYVLTMVNLYVLEGLGSLRPIDRDRFRRLSSG
jgi:predicted acylesterase/phospholipase RssA